jgi:hypothetical protein
MQDLIEKQTDLSINEERDIYAFKHIATGELNATITVSCKSDITYQESRKKHHKMIDKKINCEPHNHFNQNTSMSTIQSDQFQNCEPNFKAEEKTFIYIIGKDEEENNAILNSLQEKMLNVENHHITMCHLHTDGKVTFCSDNRKITVNDYYTFSIHTLGKSILEKIDENTKSYIDHIVKDQTNVIKAEILHVFENTVNEKANEFFEKKSGFMCFK